nr:MAG TPA: hypothetical protein [Ackermannviridae sp.]
MGPFFLPIPFQKKNSKKFFHIFSRRVINSTSFAIFNNFQEILDKSIIFIIF